MKAVTWHGRRDVRVDRVPDPFIKEPTDAIVRITTTGICGSDLHLYETLGPFIDKGDILGRATPSIIVSPQLPLEAAAQAYDQSTSGSRAGPKSCSTPQHRYHLTRPQGRCLVPVERG
jgi:hypothetical protein